MQFTLQHVCLFAVQISDQHYLFISENAAPDLLLMQ